MSHLLKGMWLLLLVVASYNKANSTNSFSPSSSTDPEREVVTRLADLELPLVASAADAHFQRKIVDYLDRGGRSTERMLGRANVYFPVFEYYLTKHDLPESLKYLAVAESMLVPKAVSSARAAGLWQLMPATAREMGLRVDGTVDERLDVYRSTEAAVIMLKSLFAQFGDWHLALAAYNCGPGRVRRAIRSAGGYSQYGKVKRFLPKESQKYVAAYVAAAYTLNYYDDYGLTPSASLFNLDEVNVAYVYRGLNLRRAARATNIPYATLHQLNPRFVRGYVPASRSGFELRLPKELVPTMQAYLWGNNNLVELDGHPDADLAIQVLAGNGVSVRAILLGVNESALTHVVPSEPMLLYEEALSVQLYQDMSLVAMLD